MVVLVSAGEDSNSKSKENPDQNVSDAVDGNDSNQADQTSEEGNTDGPDGDDGPNGDDGPEDDGAPGAADDGKDD